jgi:hypothetical protein
VRSKCLFDISGTSVLLVFICCRYKSIDTPTAQKILVTKSKKKSLRKAESIWEDNIKTEYGRGVGTEFFWLKTEFRERIRIP